MIALLGSSGELARYLQKNLLIPQNMKYVRYGRTNEPEGNKAGIPFVYYSIGSRLDLSQEKFTLILNCAFDFKNRQSDFNLDLINNLILPKNCLLINFSTVQVENQDSNYGAIKLKIENKIIELGGLNLRLGVLRSSPPISNVKKIVEVARKLKFFPIPSGNQFVLETDLEKLVSVLRKILKNPSIYSGETQFVVNREPVRLIEIIKDAIPKGTTVISIPYQIVKILVITLNKIKVAGNLVDQLKPSLVHPAKFSSWNNYEK